MPVLAARLADVLVGDPSPLVAGGVSYHPLDQLAVLVLDVGVVVERKPDVLDPGGERVTHALELVDREKPRAADAGNREVDALPREGRAEQASELQLECRDLAAQVGARSALVVLV